jgi:tetratricopeptide (TPR) repeat protein
MRIRYLLPTLIVLICIVASYTLSVRLFSMIRYQKAENRVRSGDFEEAVSLLTRATRYLPKHAAVWKALGKAYQEMIHHTSISKAFFYAKASEKAYREATRIAPLDAESVFELATVTEQLEQLDVYVNPGITSRKYHALPYFQKAIRLRPNGILYRYELARYLYLHHEKQELLKAITEFTGIYPPAYHHLKSETFWFDSTRQAAIKGVMAAIQKGVEPGSSHMILAQLLEEKKDYRGAIESYRKALAYTKDENKPTRFYQLGRLYLENEQKDEAEKIFLTALSISLNRENDLKNLYRHYKRKRATEDFIEIFKSARNRFAVSDQTNILLANALADIKHYREAITVLKDLNEKDPNAEAFYAMARIFEKEQDWDAMELAIQKATVYDPKNSQYHLIFSQVLKRLKKHEAAEKATEKAIATASSPSASLHNHRAWLRWELEKYPGAAEDWESATRLAPANASFHAWAAEAYIKMGDMERAAEYYRQAMDIDPGNTNYRRKFQELNSGRP